MKLVDILCDQFQRVICLKEEEMISASQDYKRLCMFLNDTIGIVGRLSCVDRFFSHPDQHEAK